MSELDRYSKEKRESFRPTDLSYISLFEEIKKFSTENGITLDQAIEIFKLKEHQTSQRLYLDNGNIWDVQIKELTEIVKKLELNTEEIL